LYFEEIYNFFGYFIIKATKKQGIEKSKNGNKKGKRAFSFEKK